MCDGHFAVNAFLRKRDHLRLLPSVSAGEEIAASGMGNFFMRIGVVRGTDVVHKVADLPRLGLVEIGALDFLYYHGALPKMCGDMLNGAGEHPQSLAQFLA